MLPFFEYTEADRAFYRDHIAPRLPSEIFDVHVHAFLQKHVDMVPEYVRTSFWASECAVTLSCDDAHACARELYPDSSYAFAAFPTVAPEADTIGMNEYIADMGRIVMGHMGESNPAMGTRTILRRKKFAFGEALDPVVADVTMPEGERATVVNLGIVEDNAFRLIAFTGEICERISGASDIDMPYFHFKPDMALTDFLTAYGEAGGTHHAAMTLGDRTESIIKLAEMLGIDLEIIG